MFRKIVKLFAYCCAAILILALAAALLSDTAWFKEKVRQRIVAAVEEASGGHVELGGFAYNWHTLTATFQNFVVHGTEPVTAPPLFRAASIKVQLRVLSVLQRKVAVSSILIDKPNIYVLVRSDGSTNIPTPDLRQKTPDITVQDLLNLKLRHFELSNGSFRTDLQDIPLNARGDDTAVSVSYNRIHPSYSAKVICKQFYLNSNSFQPVAMAVSAQTRLEKDRLTLESGTFISGSSIIRAAGSLRSFSQPVVDMQLNADLTGSDVARIAGIPQLQGGRVQFTGALHRDSGNAFELSGNLKGRNLAVQANGYALKDCELTSDLSASAGRISLSNVKLSLAWARFTGAFALLHNRNFSLEGHIAGLNIPEAGRFFLKKQPALPVLGSGAIRISGLLDRSPRNVVIETRLDLTPAVAAVPISGHIEAIYHQAGNTIDLANSELTLPHTLLSVSGRVNQNLRAIVDSTNLSDLSAWLPSVQLPKLASNGSAHFDGSVTGTLDQPHITGAILLNHFAALGDTWDRLQTQADISFGSAALTGLSIDRSAMH